MKIKLTDIQKNELAPLVDAKNKADRELIKAVLLIVGKPIAQYSIANGELEVDIIEDKPIEEPK